MKQLYINLDKHTERRKLTEREFPNAIRIEGYDSDKLDSYTDIIYKSQPKISKNSICCSLSHIKCIKYAYENDYEDVIISEDDVIISKYKSKWEKDIEEIIKDRPEDCNCIVLASNNILTYINKEEYIRWKNGLWGAFYYWLDKTAISILYKRYVKNGKIDISIENDPISDHNLLYPHVTTYMYTTPLVTLLCNTTVQNTNSWDEQVTDYTKRYYEDRDSLKNYRDGFFTYSYVNFFDYEPGEPEYIRNFISNSLNKGFMNVTLELEPDFLLCSVFGPLSNVIDTKAKNKILYCPENIHNVWSHNLDHREYSSLTKHFDLIIGFEDDMKNNILYFPIWMTQYPIYDASVVDFLENEHNKYKKIQNVDCTMVCRHDISGIRVHMLKRLPKCTFSGGGKMFNRDLGRGFANKFKFIVHSKYNLCPENSNFPGYCTEKIFNAYQAGNIPIYWGAIPEPKLLNEKKYIMYTGEKIEFDDSKFDEPIFKPGAKKELQKRYDSFKNAILKLCEKHHSL